MSQVLTLKMALLLYHHIVQLYSCSVDNSVPTIHLAPRSVGSEFLRNSELQVETELREREGETRPIPFPNLFYEIFGHFVQHCPCSKKDVRDGLIGFVRVLRK